MAVPRDSKVYWSPAYVGSYASTSYMLGSLCKMGKNSFSLIVGNSALGIYPSYRYWQPVAGGAAKFAIYYNLHQCSLLLLILHPQKLWFIAALPISA